MTVFSRFLGVLFLAVAAMGTTLSQSMTQGTLKFAVTDVKTDAPEMQQMIGGMKGMSQVIEFDGQKQKMTMEMMGGLMKIKTYWSSSTKSMETYMDMMGQKIKTLMSMEEMEKMQGEEASGVKSSDIVYDKSARKEILGLDCYKASFVTEANGQKLSMEMYVTEDIKVPNSFVQNLNQVELKGTPLMWIMDAGMMKMTFQATEVSKDLASDFFEKPEGDYQQLSMEQLKQMGMGGQLGF